MARKRRDAVPASAEQLLAFVGADWSLNTARAMARRYGVDYSDADDIAQETFYHLSALAALPGMTASELKRKSLGFMRNRISEVYKRNRRHADFPVEEALDPHSFSTKTEDETQAANWKLALARSIVGTSTTRFFSSELEGVPQKVEARQMGLSDVAFHRKKKKALARMKRVMQIPVKELSRLAFLNDPANIELVRAELDPKFLKRWDRFTAELHKINRKFRPETTPVTPPKSTGATVEALHDGGVYVRSDNYSQHIVATATSRADANGGPRIQWKLKRISSPPRGLPRRTRFQYLLGMIADQYQRKRIKD